MFLKRLLVVVKKLVSEPGYSENMLYLGGLQNVFTSYKKRRHMLNLPETFLRPPVKVVLKTFL